VWCADVTYIPMARGFALSGCGDGLEDARGAFLEAVQYP
jgi:hypothetical protein